MELTDAQLKLIAMYAKKADLKVAMVEEWIRDEKITISELSQWVLWTLISGA